MRIIEHYIEGKTNNPDECEDGIFVNEHFVAVVDGATSKTETVYEGAKTGRIARDLVLDALGAVSHTADARTLMRSLNAAFYSWYSARGIAEMVQKVPAERCVASVVIYAKEKRELWMVGDCQARIDDQVVTNTKYIDTVVDAARAAFLEAEVRKGVSLATLRSHDTGREYIQPLLERQNYFQNTGSGTVFDYEVIDGFFTDTLPIKIVPVPLGAQEVVLASDGYPVLAKSLSESEALLAEVLATDPLLFKTFRSPKGCMEGSRSFDDRAFIRFQP